GVNEFGGRFFVSLCGVLTVLLLFWWLRRLKGENFAFWTSLIFLSLLDFIVMASVAMPDVVLLLFITGALIFFFEGHREKSSNFYRLAFLSAGLATLTKGPVGLVLPGLVAVVYLVLRREFLRTLKEIPWLSGMLVYLAAVLPWYGAILYKHGYQFFKDFIIFHNIHRFTGKVPGHPTEWWYYPANYFWLFLPWSLFFPFGIYRLFKDREWIVDALLTFSVVWFFTVFLFFQIAHTKLAHYLLPSFPAFSIIVAWYLQNYREKIPVILTAMLFTILTLAGAAFWKIKNWPATAFAFVIPAFLGAWLSHFKGNPLKTLTTSFIASMLLFKFLTLPSLEPLRAKPAVGKELNEIKKRCKNCRIVFLDYTSPEIIYYYRLGKIEDLPAEAVKKLLKGKDPVIVVTRENRLKKLKGVNYSVIDKKKELLTKHSIVVITNKEEIKWQKRSQ
ncbi:MAG: glycosyltransferase family 39 protein, partial [Desulfurobacteriaceae bacterium]